MLAKRGKLLPLREPQYEFRAVPRCSRDLTGSVIIPVEDRNVWVEALAEILLLCNEAAYRRRTSHYVPPAARGKPLALEYLADRMDLDDPLTGHMVRTETEGWLQGFVTVTTFTTWQRWFRWDSLLEEAGISDESIDEEEDEELREWLKARKRDLDGSLAAELQAQVHDGDFTSNGVIWPHVAEISLLGGLGCGSWIMKKIIYDLEAPSSKYDYVVLQATENAVEFYERFGFVRVGAVARYEKLDGSDNDSEDEESEESEDEESDEEESEEDSSSSSEDDGDSDSEDSATEDEEAQGNSKAVDSSSTVQLSSRELRARRRSEKQMEEKSAGGDESMEEADGGSDAPEARRTADGQSDKAENGKNSRSSHITSNFFWYETKADESPQLLGKKFGVSAFDIVFLNKTAIPSLTTSARMYGGTKLRIPVKVDIEQRKEEMRKNMQQQKKTMEPGDISDPTATFYFALDDESPRQMALKLGVDAKELIRINKKRIEGINMHARLVEGTKVRIPGRVANSVGGDDADEEDAPALVAYRHWTFSNDSVDTTCVSYMMVRRLNKRKASRSSYVEVPAANPIVEQYERARRTIHPEIIANRFRRSRKEEARKRKLEERIKAEKEKRDEEERIKRFKALPRKPISVKLRMKGLSGKRLVGPLNAAEPLTKKRFKVYLSNTGCIGGPLRANLFKPLLEPMPRLPEKPKRNLSGYLIFSNSLREELTKKNPDLKITEISKLIGAKWGGMSNEEKAIYKQKSDAGKAKYQILKDKYDKAMANYNYHYSLRAPERAWKQQENLGGDNCRDDRSLSAKAAKKKVTHVQLFNKVVRLLHNENGWEYYFVLTYIPDLQWCHVAPMMQCGMFTTEKRGIAMGRPKFMLVPEGKASELDVSASRCVVVRTRVMKGCPNADKEEWDVLESTRTCVLGDSIYLQAFQSLGMNKLFIDSTFTSSEFSNSAGNHPSSPQISPETVFGKENNHPAADTPSAPSSGNSESFNLVSGVFICQACRKEFKSKEELVLHIKQKHSAISKGDGMKSLCGYKEQV